MTRQLNSNFAKLLAVKRTVVTVSKWPILVISLYSPLKLLRLGVLQSPINKAGLLSKSASSELMYVGEKCPRRLSDLLFYLVDFIYYFQVLLKINVIYNQSLGHQVRQPPRG